MPSPADNLRLGAAEPVTRPRRLHALRYALIVALIGLLLTGLLTWWRAGADADLRSDQLSEHGRLLAFETRDLLDEAALQLTATASLFLASDYVSADEFELFVDDLGLMPGVVGLGYVPVVSRERLDEWLADARTEVPGLTLFELAGDGSRLPLQERETHYPLLYFEPHDSAIASVGVDVGAERQRVENMLNTMADQPVAMSTFLSQDDAPEPFSGFMIMAKAVREPGSDEYSEFVLGVIDLAQLIDGNTAAEVTKGLVWSVEDRTGLAEQPTPESGTWYGSVEFGGRVLGFSVSPDQTEYPWPTGLAGMILLSGIAISLLIGAVVHLVLGRLEARAEMEVLESINNGKDDFLAAVSHGLRTPLTAVVGFSEILRERGDDLSDDERSELVSTIAVQAFELGHLFDNLLTVTRDVNRGSLMATEVPLAQEASAVLETTDPQRRFKVRLTDVDPAVVAAGDSAPIRQILRNLISNAADFGDRVEVSVSGDDRFARVTVRDNGPGVPAERGDIFARYDGRIDAGQPESMGVGLYVSRRLAQSMGGDLTYRREGDWTVFELAMRSIPNAATASRDLVPATTEN